MRRVMFVAASMCVAVIAMVAPASATSYVDDAVASVKTTSVYIAPGADGTNAETAGEFIQKLNKGDRIVIVMLPADTAANVPEILRKIDTATGKKGIIGLAVGDKLYAYSTVMPSGVATDLMNRAKDVSTSTTETLSTYIRNVHMWQDANPQAPAAKLATEGKGSSPLPAVLLLILIGVLTVGVISLVVGTNRKRHVTTNAGITFRSPNEVRELLQAIMALRLRVNDQQLRELVQQVCEDTEAYFRRFTDRSNRSDDVEAFVEHLQAIRGILNQYIEIQNSPSRYYNDPEKLMQQGYDAVSGFAAFVVTSIKNGRRTELTNYTVDTKIMSAKRYN